MSCPGIKMSSCCITQQGQTPSVEPERSAQPTTTSNDGEQKKQPTIQMISPNGLRRNLSLPLASGPPFEKGGVPNLVSSIFLCSLPSPGLVHPSYTTRTRGSHLRRPTPHQGVTFRAFLSAYQKGEAVFQGKTLFPPLVAWSGLLQLRCAAKRVLRHTFPPRTGVCFQYSHVSFPFPFWSNFQVRAQGLSTTKQTKNTARVLDEKLKGNPPNHRRESLYL